MVLAKTVQLVLVASPVLGTTAPCVNQVDTLPKEQAAVGRAVREHSLKATIRRRASYVSQVHTVVLKALLFVTSVKREHTRPLSMRRNVLIACLGPTKTNQTVLPALFANQENTTESSRPYNVLTVIWGRTLIFHPQLCVVFAWLARSKSRPKALFVPFA